MTDSTNDKERQATPHATQDLGKRGAYTSLELRIKGFTLAQEARIIRRYERRLAKAARYVPLLGAKRESLYRHRKDVVQPEARATYLAFGFLRGMPYSSIEQKRYTDPDWAKIETMVNRYGEGDSRDRLQRFASWKDSAPPLSEHSGLPREKKQRVSNGPKPVAA